jgi:PAS domain S-box-containing protein
VGYLVISRDVTQEEATRRAAEDDRRFLDNILESSTEYSIIAKDLDRRILSWNAGARRNYGYEAAEVVGRISDFLHDRSDIESGIIDRLHGEAFRTGKAEGRFLRRRKDGTTFPARVVITRRDDAKGHPVGYLLISKDVTQEEALAAELADARNRELRRLERVSQLKTEFINMAAHELATPLTPLRIQIALLRQMPDLDPRVRKAVAVLERTERRLAGLVQDLLDSARLQSGRLELSLREVDVSAVAAAATEDLQAFANLRQVRIELSQGTGTVVEGDARRIEQVLHNILHNAVKFSLPGTTVRVSTFLDGDVIVRVRDEGIGLASSDIPRLFNPFVQVHELGAAAQGSGLGLYIVRNIVEMHGGSVSIDSEGPGKGTTVEVRLPPAHERRGRPRRTRDGRGEHAEKKPGKPAEGTRGAP